MFWNNDISAIIQNDMDSLEIFITSAEMIGNAFKWFRIFLIVTVLINWFSGEQKSSKWLNGPGTLLFFLKKI